MVEIMRGSLKKIGTVYSLGGKKGGMKIICIYYKEIFVGLFSNI